MVVILGGGLAGMSTAYHLRKAQPGQACVIFEKEDTPGGLCRSDRIDGFTFDFTGHYLHLRDPEMIAWVDELVGEEMIEVPRRSSIHSHGRRLDFPFQANLHGLPVEVVARCLTDFVHACGEKLPEDAAQMPFGQWARKVFGNTIAEEFMIPYNSKQFGIEADELTAEWVAWAVPRPDVSQVIRGALGLKNEGLGYNPCFRYPRSGGIGHLPAALARLVEDDMQLSTSVTAVDAASRTVTLAEGQTVEYDQLVSTLPLPHLLRMVSGLDAGHSRTLKDLAGRLRWSAVVELRLGVARDEIAHGDHWIYYPEAEYAFYRVGFPSNVCDAMAPEGCSSLSVEFFHRPGDPVPKTDALVAQARAGLERAGILDASDEIIVAETSLLDPAYVLFDRLRTPVVEQALERLENAEIHSIGRFGAWTYSYMERALMDGRHAARSLLARAVT